MNLSWQASTKSSRGWNLSKPVTQSAVGSDLCIFCAAHFLNRRIGVRQYNASSTRRDSVAAATIYKDEKRLRRGVVQDADQSVDGQGLRLQRSSQAQNAYGSNRLRSQSVTGNTRFLREDPSGSSRDQGYYTHRWQRQSGMVEQNLGNTFVQSNDRRGNSTDTDVRYWNIAPDQSSTYSGLHQIRSISPASESAHQSNALTRQTESGDVSQWRLLRRNAPFKFRTSETNVESQREARKAAQDARLRESRATGGRFTSLKRTQPDRTSACSVCGDPNHLDSKCPKKVASSTPRIRRITTGNETIETIQEVSLDRPTSKRQSMQRRSTSSQEEHGHLPSFDVGTQGAMGENQSDHGGRKPDADRRTAVRKERYDERMDRDRRRGRNLTYAREAIANAMEERDRTERRRQKELRRQLDRTSGRTALPQLQIPTFISVGQLAALLKQRWDRFERKLKSLGYEHTQQSHVLSAENAGLIAMEYGFEPVIEEVDEDLHAAPVPDDISILPSRPPVVTIMGHVDHGKTTILDYLRKSSIAATEHGGITQHIGAFSVPLKSGKAITFLDTPGHAAFLDMRQRGATVTDIVILVVAADDSVMPQTIEAIKHAKAAQVPIIVAVNKMDKEDARPDRVKQDLARYGVEVEDFGGDTQAIHVSGKTGFGMADLEEAIITLSEIQDVRADPMSQVEGWVLEGSKKKAGRSATVLIRRGTLRRGNIIVAGNTWARVRTMKNEANQQIDEVGPGMPAVVEGWKDQPVAGDEVLQAPTEQKAGDVVSYRKSRASQVKMAADLETINQTRRAEQERRDRERAAVVSESGHGTDQKGEQNLSTEHQEHSTGPKEVIFIVKADVTGSVEAVLNTVSAISNNEVQPKIIRSDVGAVSLNDIEYAAAGEGHIIAFNVNSDFGVERSAEDRGVRILQQNIIYRLEDEVKAIMSQYLTPTVKQKVTGEAEVAQIFSIKIKNRDFVKIAGSRVLNGSVTLNSLAKVLRGPEKKVVHVGKITSLKHVKKDVTEMAKGTECGIGFEDWDGLETADQIQCYVEWTEKRSL